MLARFLTLLSLVALPSLGFAFGDNAPDPLNLNATTSVYGIMALIIFVVAYLLVMGEEYLHLRKSKPVVLAAGIIWMLVCWVAVQQGASDAAVAAVRHNLLEYAELFLFLLVAMTYVNAMEERQVFESLRIWLVQRGYSYRQLFWITGILAFFISPVADNLTTALLMCAVVMAVGANNPKFVGLSCINIVIAANAGGAFSPFGDITTLMVWQKGLIHFTDFFKIFFPSLVNFLIPALLMSMAVPSVKPDPSTEKIRMYLGAKRIILLFLLTIIITVAGHQFLHLPPVIGMMTGLGLLKMFAYYLRCSGAKDTHSVSVRGEYMPFDIFNKVARAEWDTLLFFYGVVLCVGGLATFGYLELISNAMYYGWGQSLPAIHSATPANITVGILSAIIDNIPVMFAVLTMDPAMSEGQWLLVTLTAGVGGSLLSIGSAAGVALMGQAKGHYTFFGHLKWIWAIALGYIASIAVHIWINADTFLTQVS